MTGNVGDGGGGGGVDALWASIYGGYL